MAITFIMPRKTTGNVALKYAEDDKKAKMVDEKNSSLNALNYAIRDKKGNVYNLSEEYLQKMKNYITVENGTIGFKTLATYINCSKEHCYEEWENVRSIKNPQKGHSGNIQYCITQNFGIDLDPLIAQQIGVEFAQEYLKGYQCVVATHINTGLVHNHIEFNATSLSGKKFNDDLQAVADIRKVSDELCRKYGLEVLDETRDFRFVLFKDENGRVKAYEPTERKNNKLHGEVADKNSYVNTEQYKEQMEFLETHVSTLKKDFDRFVPLASSYDDFLSMMESVGYEIKSKQKNGNWLKHISFKLPEWEKYVRDSRIGEEYCREKIIERISNNNLEKNIEKVKTDSHIYIPTEYEYGKFDIERLDEEYYYRKRKRKDSKEYIERKVRSEIEKTIIRDTKVLNAELSKRISLAVKPQRDAKEVIFDNGRNQYLYDCINNGLKSLKFIEDKEIKSMVDLNERVRSLCLRRKECYSSLKSVADVLKKGNELLETINKYETLKSGLKADDNELNNNGYLDFESDTDRMLLKTYESLLKEYGLTTEKQRSVFRENMESRKAVFEKLSDSLEAVNREIQKYDDCIYTMTSIDRRNGGAYAMQISDYKNIKDGFEEKENRENQEERIQE